MSQISSMFGNLPGMGTVIETYEAAITWGSAWQMKWWNGWIDANTVDVGNTGTTWRLRPGLVLGQTTATGRWTNYNATNTDGSQVARGILAYGLRMQDVLSGLNTQKLYAILIGGNLKGANLLGLDMQARAQLSPFFTFDDILGGENPWDWIAFQTKVANYQIVTGDNFSHFDNTGAVGEVDFTLPPIANGYKFGFRNVAAQTLKVISNEGGNIVALNNPVANSLAFATGGQQIGAGLVFYSNAAGTKWYVNDVSTGGPTITVA
jgi:hypothetical protein